MNIWQQFNLVNQSFLSNWRILLANAIVFYIHWAIKKSLAVFNLADFCNLPYRQNKFYTKFSSYTEYHVQQKTCYKDYSCSISGCSHNQLPSWEAVKYCCYKLVMKG